MVRFSLFTMLLGLCFMLYLTGHVVMVTKSKSNSYLAYKKKVRGSR